MLTQTDYDNIILWSNEWFANQVKCMNQNICLGIDSSELCRKIADIFLIRKSIVEAVGILDEDKIDNLYRRLQCLINLFVQ